MTSIEAYNVLTSLLRSGVLGTKPDEGLLAGMSAEGWKEVMNEASRQSVIALAFDGLPDNAPGLPVELFFEWASRVKQVEQGGMRLRAVLDKQKAVWESNGLHPYVLKGSVCAGFYPIPLHRQSGDIDWCFERPEEWDKAVEILRGKGIAMRTDSDGDFSYRVADVVVEHHRKGLHGQSLEALVCYLVDHVFHHFSTSGIGLKQFCDLALILKKGGVDESELARILDMEGLGKFNVLAKSFIAEDFLGEPAPAGIARDVKLFRSMVIRDGNFGLDKKRRFSGMAPKAWICLRYAPKAFVSRWTGLVAGRLERSRIGK